MINVLSLCDGMGTGKLAFDSLGLDVNYYAIEIKEYSRKVADDNLDGIIRPCNDLLDLTPRQIFLDLPKFDYVLFGFSCKSLSRQSNGKNLEGSSKILFDCMNILAAVKYRNPRVKFLIENVFSMTNEMKKIISGIIDIDFTAIDSSLLSGQGRKRLYWFNWPMKDIVDMKIEANSILEEDAIHLKAWSKSTRYRDENGKIFSSPGPGRESYIEERFRTDGKANTLVTGKGCIGQSTKNIVLQKNGKERNLTVRECARLQSIPEFYSFKSISDSQAYNCLGDGWELETIKHIINGSL